MAEFRQNITLNYKPDGILPLGSSLLSVASGVPNIQSGGTLLFSEDFNDSAFASRGWYDLAAPFVLDSVNPHSGASAARFTFQQGSTSAEISHVGRRLFTPTSQVYIEYWVRYSSNYIGSGQTFHPHEWLFLTNEDSAFVGPSSTRLSSYVETRYLNGNINGALAHTDNVNIDQANIGVDLTQITELRGANGCNGLLENTQSTVSCFDSGGGVFVGGRLWDTPGPIILDADKTNWNKIGAFFKLNTLSGGKANIDGVMQMFVNDILVLNFPNMVMRTGEFPNMLYEQLFLGPFIGTGSPVTQSIYYDDLLIATEKP